MDAKNILGEIKKLVFGDEQNPEVQMKEYSLDNGTKVMISDLAVGGQVTLEDGSPAPVGSHTLADGTKLEVSEGGVIAAVMPAEAPAEVQDMGTAPQAPNYDARFTEIETNYGSLKQAFENTANELKGLKEAFAKQEELNQKCISILDTMIQEPATKPAEHVKSGFVKQHEGKQEKLQRLFKLFKQ